MFIERGMHQISQSPSGAACTIRLDHGLYGFSGLHREQQEILTQWHNDANTQERQHCHL